MFMAIEQMHMQLHIMQCQEKLGSLSKLILSSGELAVRGSSAIGRQCVWISLRSFQTLKL